MKKYIFLAVLAIIAGGVYYLATNLESIVKKVVHTYGSEVTGTDVAISGFDLSIREGSAAVNKITVANPKGYKTPYLFELDQVSVKIDIKSLTTDTIIIEKVEVKKPVVTYEMVSFTKNNVLDVQNNINGYSAKSAKAKESIAKEPKKEEAPSKNVVIKSLVIDSGELGAFTNIPGIEKRVSVKLPAIKMNNIGGTSGKGKDIPTVISEIITQILTSASQTAINSNITDIKNVAQENLDGAVSSAKNRADETKGALKNLLSF